MTRKTQKKLRKLLTLVSCAVLLVCVTVAGTVAYLTSTTNVVENTFAVGKVAITLDEAKVDEYGVPVEGADRVAKNNYKLMPGHTYTKDPTIHVQSGSEVSYLFVKVVDGIAAIQDATTIANQMSTNGWVKLDAEGVENVYYYNKTVDARTAAQDVKVFETFKVKSDANVSTYTGATITVQAYAVQADGFDSAATAYAAAPCTWGANTAA